MEIEAHHEKVLTALKEQMVFLQSQMEEPEKAEVGKEELEHLLSALKEATEYLEAHPPAEPAEDEDEVEMEVEPAEADEEAEVVPPEDVDDAEGWLAYLAANPDDSEALEHLERLETKGRLDQDWDTVSTVLFGRLDIVEEQEGRLDILRELGRIYEQEIGDLAKTFDVAQVAHSLNPTDEGLGTPQPGHPGCGRPEEPVDPVDAQFAYLQRTFEPSGLRHRCFGQGPGSRCQECRSLGRSGDAVQEQ
jgi:hypothetical protein